MFDVGSTIEHHALSRSAPISHLREMGVASLSSVRNVSLREEEVSQREPGHGDRPEHNHVFDRQYRAHHNIKGDKISEGRQPREAIGGRPQTSREVKQECGQSEQTRYRARDRAAASRAESHRNTAPAQHEETQIQGERAEHARRWPA